MSKIYTGTGDEGMTSLIGGKRSTKAADIVHAYGTIDELAAFIGLLSASLPEDSIFRDDLQKVQQNLLVIESYYATGDADTKYLLDAALIRSLEEKIDELDSRLPALKAFIIPGTGILSSYAHICRTVCRRAERHVVKIDSGSNNLTYLNRLSDYFFVLARTFDNR